jgi:hypothetical protein
LRLGLRLGLGYGLGLVIWHALIQSNLHEQLGLSAMLKGTSADFSCGRLYLSKVQIYLSKVHCLSVDGHMDEDAGPTYNRRLL